MSSGAPSSTSSFPADQTPHLNPALDRAALRDSFARDGRLHVRDVLTADSAARIHACLEKEAAWGLCLNTDDKPRGLRNVTQQQLETLTHQAWNQVGTEGFRFLYEQQQLSLNGESYADPDHHWARVVAFLNGPDFLDLAREITGLGDIAFADAQATLYRPGHFLTAHDDDIPGTNRLAAYVMSFTASWRPEWGGLLEFIGEDHHIAGGYTPDFNSLKIFRIPATHHVSMVAPFARAGRYAITGWLRAR
jgi:Rps23 Pro-64 3,4-dihydroxylase Tpa1-like proline 4-hydroxylase